MLPIIASQAKNKIQSYNGNCSVISFCFMCYSALSKLSLGTICTTIKVSVRQVMLDYFADGEMWTNSSTSKNVLET